MNSIIAPLGYYEIPSSRLTYQPAYSDCGKILLPQESWGYGTEITVSAALGHIARNPVDTQENDSSYKVTGHAGVADVLRALSLE